MAISLLQDYCLDLMGITQWQSKANMVDPKPYLLLLNENLSEEKNQLLTRLIQALKWPLQNTHIEVIANWHYANIEALIDKYQVQKLVVFNEQFDFEAKGIAYVAIPSVSEMLNNIEAKKRAWAVLQKLVG